MVERGVRPRKGSVSIAALEALQREQFDRVVALLHNDFQEPIARCSAEIRQTFEALHLAGAGNALLAGSGSCVFSLAETGAQIEALASRVKLPAEYLRFATSFARTANWREPCSTP